MAFEENLGVFFDLGGFADEVRVVSTGRKFPAIFDESFFDPQTGETILETTSPRLTCKMTDAQGLAKKSKVTVKGRTFTVLEIQPEGTGTAVVILSHQSE